MSSPVTPGNITPVRAYLLERLRRALHGRTDPQNPDYSKLVTPNDWQNVFLATHDLGELREMRASWEGGNIHHELRDEIEEMRKAGVTLVKGQNHFILFARIE